MRPVISVIVPVYNTEKYLRACLESIIDQTFREYEIILVDDGSTDSSGSICDEYSSRYSFISVIHKENGGIASARKAGIEKAAGKYISYIDSDDSIDPDMYENMMDKADQYDADVIICEMTSETGKYSVLQKNAVESGYYDKKRLQSEFYPRMLFSGEEKTFGISPSLCNKIFRRSLLKDIIMNTEESISFGEDALCSFPCLLDAEKVYVLNKAFYHYRMVNSSSTHSYDKELMCKFILLIELLDREFKKRDFDGKWQLAHYTARFSLECIRKELLFNRELPLKKRITETERYLEQPRVAEAFQAVSYDAFGGANNIKMKLIGQKRLFLLYLLFSGKEFILRLQNRAFG